MWNFAIHNFVNGNPQRCEAVGGSIFILPIKNCAYIKIFLTKAIGGGLDQADFFTGRQKNLDMPKIIPIFATRNKDNN